MQTAEGGKQMIKKIVILFLSGITSSGISAGFFDKETKVKNYVCDDNNRIFADSPVIWTFTVEKNSVIQKYEVYENKNLKGTDLYRLDNCIVIDKANWKCGGTVIQYPKGGSWTDRTYQVIKGKYTFKESSSNGRADMNMFCKIEQVN
jgi:hypothetical protein